MRYTLGQAARATGKGKTTIQRAIQRGDLSAEKNADGSYSIDASELSRVYPLVHLDSHEEQEAERDETPVVHVAVLEERLKARDATIEALEERLRDAETVRDRLLEQNERLTRLLAAPQPETLQPVPASPVEMPEARPWWKFW